MNKIISLFIDIVKRVFFIKDVIHLIRMRQIFISLILISLFLVLFIWFRQINWQDFVESKKALGLSSGVYWPALTFFIFLQLVTTVLGLAGLVFWSVLGGFLFGFSKGMGVALFGLFISLISSFFFSRYVLTYFFWNKIENKVHKIRKRIRKKELRHILLLCTFPLMPISYSCMILGLSSVRFFKFLRWAFLVTGIQVVVYANMGTELANIKDWREAMDPRFILSFALVGICCFSPDIISFALKKVRRGQEEDLTLEYN